MGSHTRTAGQKVCTACFCLCWLVMAIGTIMLHASVASLVPSVVDLPDNMAFGFKSIFGFASLEAETVILKNAAAQALAKCNIVASVTACNNLPPNPPLSETSDTSAEVKTINSAFDRALTKIVNVGKDKYFGVKDLKDVAQNLENITADLVKVPKGESPCLVNNALFCAIWKSVETLNGGISKANAQIDSFTNTKEVRDFKDQAGNLKLLHGLPYVLVLSMVFFSCFWYADQPACCCCSEKKGAGCAYFLHLLLWLVFFIVTVSVVGSGYAVKEYVKTERIKGTFQGDPTAVELIDHIETEYPEFYDVALRDLINSLAGFLLSMTILAVIVLFIFVYGCGLCCRCGKPYYEDRAKVQDMSVVIPKS